MTRHEKGKPFGSWSEGDGDLKYLGSSSFLIFVVRYMGRINDTLFVFIFCLVFVGTSMRAIAVLGIEPATKSVTRRGWKTRSFPEECLDRKSVV